MTTDTGGTLATNAPAAKPRASRWRYLLWLLIFLVGIVVGWLLAPRLPGKSCFSGAAGQSRGSPSSGSGAAGHSSSGATSGAPDGLKLSPESGDLDLGSGRKRPISESDAGGAGKGRPRPSDEAIGGVQVKDQQSEPADVTPGGASLVEGPDQHFPDASGHRVLKADDFRYDKTGLPRYAESVTTMGSTLAHERGATGGYHSTCVIATASSFDDVVTWYKTHLPADWHAQTVGDLGALAQQVSIDNIMKTLTAPAQNAAASSNPAGSAAHTDAAHTDAALSVAMFSPPPGTSGEPGILIRQRAGQDVIITMSRLGRDP